ncbi:MAG: glycosyltransferase, partial [bacterium]|nr:glycosyltransferase [bacterium]
MKFLLVIPVYNEEKIMERTLDKVLNEFRGESLTSFLKGFDVEILVVDNASTDNTSTVVNEYIVKKKYDELCVNLIIIKILEKGKGIAILTGAREAEREAEKVGVDFFGFIDADLSIHPK